MHDRWGYIDHTGDIVIEPRFDSAQPFSGGMGLVRENGLYGFIDKRGFYVIAPNFKRAESFSDDVALVGNAGDGQVWYIDRHGKQAFPRKFAEGSSFFKGLAHVKLLPRSKNDDVERFEYIDTDGNTVFAYTPYPSVGMTNVCEYSRAPERLFVVRRGQECPRHMPRD